MNTNKIPNILILLLFPLLLHAQKDDTLTYMSDDDEYNLVIASLKGDYSIVADLLNKDISANLVLEESISPLIYAAIGGRIRVAKLLIAKGADVNINPRNGHTPLIAATKYRQLDMVDFLLIHGAIINLSNDFGRTSIIYAAANGDSTMIAKLISNGASVNHRDTTGCDALMAAVSRGFVDIVEMLLLAGAQANTSDNQEITPLMLAAANRDYNMINILISYNADINAVSRNKQSALTIAIAGNDEVFVQYLIEQGANVNQKLKFSETPLTVAHYLRSDMFFIDNLKDKGAKQNIFPDFRKFFVGPSFSFNDNDFMPGLMLGIRDYKYEVDLTVGFNLRAYASRVLYKSNMGDYFQFWERRYSFYVAADKHFLLKINKYHHRQGISAGFKVHNSFFNYRGIDLSTENEFVFAPEIGYYYTAKYISAGINYSYCDFGKDGVMPSRLELSVKFLLGKAFNFNIEDYKIWE